MGPSPSARAATVRFAAGTWLIPSCPGSGLARRRVLRPLRFQPTAGVLSPEATAVRLAYGIRRLVSADESLVVTPVASTPLRSHLTEGSVLQPVPTGRSD